MCLFVHCLDYVFLIMCVAQSSREHACACVCVSDITFISVGAEDRVDCETPSYQQKCGFALQLCGSEKEKTKLFF